MFKINERNLIGIVFTGFIVIFVIGLVLSNCYSVNTGEVAVISTFGKITRVDTEGLNFKIPFVQSKDYMETREKTYIFGKTDEQDTTLVVSTKGCNSAVFKRSGGALSTGLVVCAGRHGGAVLHRLPALPWYSELPEYQQRGRP